VADDQVVIELLAEVKGLRDDLNKAQETLKGFSDKTKSQFEELGKTMTRVFSLAAIAGFVKEAVGEFAKYERAIDSFSRKVEASGLSWKSVEGELKAYLERIKETTRFSDDEALGALDKIMLRTNDYAASLQILERAMNLSVAANMDLGDAATTLTLAYQGNERGLSMLARTLGMTKDEVRSGQELFDLLDARFTNLARSEDNVATSMDKAKHAWEDGAKSIGEGLAPAAKWLLDWGAKFANALTWIAKATQSWGVLIQSSFFTVFNSARWLIEQIRALAYVATDIFTKGPSAALDKWRERSAEATTKFRKSEEEQNSEAADMLNTIWAKADEVRGANAERNAKKRVKAREVETAANKHLIESEATMVSRLMARNMTLFTILGTRLKTAQTVMTRRANETVEHFKDRVRIAEEDTKARAQSIFEAIQSMATGLSTTISGATELMVNKIFEGGLTVVGAFKIMGEAMAKYAISALGESLIAEGTKYFAKGVAALISIVEAPAAPGLFAAGAFISGAGGVLKASASRLKLAAGGIVTAPTNALIGEDGPEAVIPLNKSNTFGETVISGDWNLNFPGVRNASDVRSGRFQQSLQMQLAKVSQRMSERKGIKVPA